MKCIKCGGDTKVTDTRELTGTLCYRWRQCKKCGYRFKTFEEPEKKQKQILHVV